MTFIKEKIDPMEYAGHIMKALPRGILLNTCGDKFNSMVIGWGHLGVIWSGPTFVIYVREGRYTRTQLDKTGEFTISIPKEKPDPVINRVCGYQSGRNVDKGKEARLTLVDAETVRTPAVAEYPLTMECKVLYSQKQILTDIPESIRLKSYPQDVDGTYPMANRDAHVAYIGQITNAYIIRTE